MKRVKKKCDKCGMMRNELTFYKGKFLCGKCRRSGKTMKSKK